MLQTQKVIIEECVFVSFGFCVPSSQKWQKRQLLRLKTPCLSDHPSWASSKGSGSQQSGVMGEGALIQSKQQRNETTLCRCINHQPWATGLGDLKSDLSQYGVTCLIITIVHTYRTYSLSEPCSVALTKLSRSGPQALRLQCDNLRTQRNGAWARFGRPVCLRFPASNPHLRSVSPVTRSIITSSRHHTEAGHGSRRRRPVLHSCCQPPLQLVTGRRRRSRCVASQHVSNLSIAFSAKIRTARLTTRSCAVTKATSSNGPISAAHKSTRRDILSLFAPCSRGSWSLVLGSSGAESPQVHAVPS